MQHFKVGDKVRFKGKTEWLTVGEIQSLCNGELNILTEGCRVWFPSSSFTTRKAKLTNRVLFSCAIKPETLSKIRLESQQSGLSHGKVIDSKFTEGGGK